MPEFKFDTRSEREEVVERLFEGNAKQYDRVVAWTTYGLDKRWKKRMLAHVPEDASRILDLASGTGIVLDMLHRRWPEAALVGVDITKDYLQLARQRFQDAEFDLTLIESNAEEVELDGTFDAIVSSYIPKYVDADVVLKRLEKNVRPGTVLSVHDFGYPLGRPPRWVWTAHMWLLKRLGPLIFPAWRYVFEDNLTDLIRQTRWHKDWPAALERHGWTDVKREKLTFRSAYVVSAKKA